MASKVFAPTTGVVVLLVEEVVEVVVADDVAAVWPAVV
jgi:hypothetical protein